MTTAFSHSWWHALPASIENLPTDLCHTCGVARFQHDAGRGCNIGRVHNAPYHEAGLPESYRYDRIPDGEDWCHWGNSEARDCRGGEDWWDVPRGYLRSYGLL